MIQSCTATCCQHRRWHISGLAAGACKYQFFDRQGNMV
jgi:hypothetical protein